jgi:hypothetical protein
MTPESKFFEALKLEQMRCANPDRMPFLCIAGFQDFIELKSDEDRMAKYLEGEDIPSLPEIGLDKRQLESMTEWFEFCGCKVFRAFSVERGFIFA